MNIGRLADAHARFWRLGEERERGCPVTGATEELETTDHTWVPEQRQQQAESVNRMAAPRPHQPYRGLVVHHLARKTRVVLATAGVLMAQAKTMEPMKHSNAAWIIQVRNRVSDCPHSWTCAVLRQSTSAYPIKR